MSAAETPTPMSPLYTPRFKQDPVGVIAELRQNDPVHELPGLGVWVVTAWRVVRQRFTDPHCTPDRRYFRGYTPPKGEFMRYLSEHGLFSAPPEEHARLRKLVLHGGLLRLGQRHVGTLEPRAGVGERLVEDVAEELVA